MGSALVSGVIVTGNSSGESYMLRKPLQAPGVRRQHLNLAWHSKQLVVYELFGMHPVVSQIKYRSFGLIWPPVYIADPRRVQCLIIHRAAC